MNWNSLSDISELNDIKSETSSPILIFKHSTRCSISKMVLSRFEREHDTTEMKMYLLDLLSYREISNQISEDFNIKHESPQVLVIKNGQCVAHANHNAINQLDLYEYL
ncbi:bacillithiol system redox-active protein YtxJ [Flavobacteriales bacterium]|jgi:bacillithiol system protein YtxJ|nr:bacillithiol system redox-active protein YtxJ [Flavobacteriales bacterium]